MKRARFSLSHFLLLVVTVLAGLMLAAVTVVAAQTGALTPEVPGGIEGSLFEPDGATPVAYGWIDIHDAEGQPWMGTDTQPNGYFSISNLPPGWYILTAYPPPGSDYAASLPVEVEVLSGQWAFTELLLTRVRISGWVQDSDTGGRIEGASVVAHDDNWAVERWDTTNISGEYKIGGVEIGVTYTLEVFPPPGSEYVPLPIHYTAVPTATNVVLEMHIPPTSVVGLVNDPAGAPVPGAGVVVFHDDFWQETGADEFGRFLFRGLPPGEFLIHAAPPWGMQGLIASEPFPILVPTPPMSVSVVITLPYAYKRATGQVVFEGTTDGVPNAMVVAHRLDAPGYADGPTDPTGAFTLSLAGGEWHLGLEPLPPPEPPVEWIFPGPPAWIVFTLPITEPETATATLKVIPTNAWVEGQILCPGGTVEDPCPNLLHPPADAIWVELRNDEIGNDAGLGPDYRFSIPIPDGWYELVVHVHSPWSRFFQGPEPMHGFVGPGQTLEVGNIRLLYKSARIAGQVLNEFGVGVPGVPVVGWQPDGFGWGWGWTDASGAYTMPVIGGEWFVEPHPGPDMPYVLRQRPQLVRVAPGGTMAGVDFVLTYAGARIEGSAVDANSYERLWGLDGWATAHVLPSEELFSDTPMRDGGFELKVRGGDPYFVGLHVPPHAPYVSGGTGPVPVPPAASVPVTVPLEHKDAAIEGALVIVGTSPPEPALGVWAEVFGEDERGHWLSAGVDPGSAGYALGVVSGTWHLRAWVDPESGYVALPTPVTVSIQSHQVIPFVDFEVWPIDALISGTVLAPDGTPVEAFVFAKGESPFVGHFETRTWSDGNGYFEMHVPGGGYIVGAALPGDELEAMGWLNPPPIDVPWVSHANPARDLELRFRRLDGEIHGTVTFAPGIVVTVTHPAYVWGWADTGEWAEAEAITSTGNTFTYTMRVVSGTLWHVGAVYEDWGNGVFYESPEEVVPVLPPSGQAFQDLELGGPQLLPQPLVVSFDGSQMQTIVLPDGVELGIPPGALVVSGTVTLFIFPTQELRPGAGHEIIGVGYEIWAVGQNGQEITQFNTNVVMTFHYPSDAVLEAHGVSEHLLVPVYYSTLVGHWILADSYVVDTVNNEITLQLRHFSKFGVASTERQCRIYLPLVLKNSQ